MEIAFLFIAPKSYRRRNPQRGMMEITPQGV